MTIRALPHGQSCAGAFSTEDVGVLRGIFDLANQNPKVSTGCEEARAMARQIVRLYRWAHHDPFIVPHFIRESRFKKSLIALQNKVRSAYRRPKNASTASTMTTKPTM